MENKKSRIKELDFFRGTAAILVILYHYTTRYQEIFSHKVNYIINFPFGKMAVSMFFILSGFLICKSISRENSAINFLWRRFIRMWPCYVVAIVITTIVICFGGSDFADRIPSIKQFICNLTMIPEYLGQKAIDGAYWTQAVEIIFYMLIVGIIFFKKKDKMKEISLIWVSISIILNLLIKIFDSSILRILGILLIRTYSQLFITGILFYYLYSKEQNKVLIYIGLFLCLINQYLALGIEYTIYYLIEISIFYAIVIIRFVKITRFINNKFIIFISSISYPLYLVHQMVGYVIINKLENLGLENEIFIFIPIAVSIILAYLLHKFVEQPVIEKTKNIKISNIFRKKVTE